MISREFLQNEIAKRLEDEEIPKKVAEILKERHGKKITKRVALLVERKLGENFYAQWDTRFGMFHLHIGKKGEENENKEFRFIFGHRVSDLENFSVEEFINRNPQYFRGASERNQKRKEMLNDPSLFDAIAEAMNVLVATKMHFEKLVDDAPDEFFFKKLLAKEYGEK